MVPFFKNRDRKFWIIMAGMGIGLLLLVTVPIVVILVRKIQDSKVPEKREKVTRKQIRLAHAKHLEMQVEKQFNDWKDATEKNKHL
jgi:hypothetical protein